jgi:hypothetical protein
MIGWGSFYSRLERVAKPFSFGPTNATCLLG